MKAGDADGGRGEGRDAEVVRDRVPQPPAVITVDRALLFDVLQSCLERSDDSELYRGAGHHTFFFLLTG